MKVYRYKVTFTSRDLGSVLDMMRYDQSRVETWDRSPKDNWSVLLTADRPPTIDRWRSFGLVPVEPATGNPLRP